MTYFPHRPAPARATGVRRWVGVATEVRTRQTRRELAYLAVTAVLGCVGLLFVAVVAVVGPVLALTIVGLPLVGVALVAARRAGSLQREVAARAFNRGVPAPARATHEPGLRGWTRSALTDRVGWRAFAYMVLHLPVVGAAFLIGALGVAAGALVLDPLWRLVHPEGWLEGSWTRALVRALVGVVVLATLPWIVRVVVRVDLRLVRSLLGATTVDAEVDLARRRAMYRAAVNLREVEGSEPMGGAGAGATPFVLDLRDGVRHGMVAETQTDGCRSVPVAGNGSRPALGLVPFHRRRRDRGLGQALACLAAEVPIPTRLHLDLNGTQLPGFVEALAETAASELMANVARHSGAGLAELSAVAGRGSLTLRVSDDGHDGVAAGDLTGLDRLSELIAPVGGHLVVSSPPGGPTDITVALPLAVPETGPAAAIAAAPRTDGPPPHIAVRTDGAPSRPLRESGRQMPRRHMS